MSCPACERSRHEGKRYCIECGAPLAEEDQTPFYERKMKRKGVPPAPQAGFRAPETTASGKHKRKYRGARRRHRVGLILGIIAAILVLLGVILLLASGRKHDDAPKGTVTTETTVVAPAAGGGEIAVFEQDDYRIVYTDTAERGGEAQLHFRLENLSDAELFFELETRGVNGRGFVGTAEVRTETVEAHAAAETDLCLRLDELAMVGVDGADAIEQITVAARVSDGKASDSREAVLYPGETDADSFVLPEAARFAKAQTVIETADETYVIGQPTVNAEGDLVLAAYWRNGSDAVQQLKLEQPRAGDAQLTGHSLALQPGTEGYQILVFRAADLEAAGLTAEDVETLTFRVTLTAEGANDVTADEDVTYAVK